MQYAGAARTTSAGAADALDADLAHPGRALTGAQDRRRAGSGLREDPAAAALSVLTAVGVDRRLACR